MSNKIGRFPRGLGRHSLHFFLIYFEEYHCNDCPKSKSSNNFRHLVVIKLKKGYMKSTIFSRFLEVQCARKQFQNWQRDQP